jgi:hypothetical protein
VVCDSSAARLDTFPAVALQDRELLFFELSAHKPPATDDSFPPPPEDTLRFGGESHGGIQLWAGIAPIESFAVTVVNGNCPYVSWHNTHSKRDSVDFTEVYRRVGSGEWLLRDIVGAHDSVFADTAVASGPYSYFLRHIASRAPNLLGTIAISLPNSPTTDAKSVTINAPPAPVALWCEGNFSPTIDCHWWNTDSSSHTVINRDGSARDTVEPGVSFWSDTSGVQSDSSYQYTMRHLSGTLLGGLSDALTGVASPVPPENLSCGGTSTSTATCVWINMENAETEIWRRRGPHYQLQATLDAGIDQFDDSGLEEGVTYTYRVRHKSGGSYTGWSNTDEATPGSMPEPYRPGRP